MRDELLRIDIAHGDKLTALDAAFLYVVSVEAAHATHADDAESDFIHYPLYLALMPMYIYAIRGEYPSSRFH